MRRPWRELGKGVMGPRGGIQRRNRCDGEVLQGWQKPRQPPDAEPRKEMYSSPETPGRVSPLTLDISSLGKMISVTVRG